jgi:hypothetical protein
MFKRAFILISLAGIYIWLTRERGPLAKRTPTDHAAEADWANEGGQNSPASV